MHLLAQDLTAGMAFPRRESGATAGPRGRRPSRNPGCPTRRPDQKAQSPLSETCLRRPSVGAGNGSPQNSAPAGSPQFGHNRPLPVSDHRNGLRRHQSVGFTPTPSRIPNSRRTLFVRPALEVADIVRADGEEFRQAHAQSLSVEQKRVLHAIERCRTAALGGHLERCDQCGHERNAYNSCADLHCPKCQSLARAKWLEKRQAELLDCEYFHVVFTLPAELATLALQNKRLMYDLLFRATAGLPHGKWQRNGRGADVFGNAVKDVQVKRLADVIAGEVFESGINDELVVARRP